MIITMWSPQGQRLGSVCSLVSSQHLKQCLPGRLKHEWSQVFVPPCIHTMPLATQLKKHTSLPLPLESGLALWLSLFSRVEQKWWCINLRLDLKRLCMFPLHSLSAVNMRKTYPDTYACFRIRMTAMGQSQAALAISAEAIQDQPTNSWPTGTHMNLGKPQEPQPHRPVSQTTACSFKPPNFGGSLLHNIKREITDILEYPHKLMDLIY